MDKKMFDKGLEIRRAVLGHAVMSFVYNTVILAPALNLFFGFVDR